MGKIVFFAIPANAEEPLPEADAQAAAAAGQDARKFYEAPFDLSIRLGFGSAKFDQHFRHGHGTGLPMDSMNISYDFERTQAALLASLGMKPPTETAVHAGTLQMLQPRIKRLFDEPDFAIAMVGTEEQLNPILAWVSGRCTDGSAIPRITPWQLIGANCSDHQVTMTRINRSPQPQPAPMA